MFLDDLKMEQKVAKIKATIVKELKAAYKQLQEDGDWEAFGLRIRDRYVSYATCSDEAHHRAMRDVLAGATREKLPEDITAGNYGLKTQACDVAAEDLKILEDMRKRYGETVMRRFLESFNVCQTYAMATVLEDRKQVEKQFSTLIDIMTKGVTNI